MKKTTKTVSAFLPFALTSRPPSPPPHHRPNHLPPRSTLARPPTTASLLHASPLARQTLEADPLLPRPRSITLRSTPASSFRSTHAAPARLPPPAARRGGGSFRGRGRGDAIFEDGSPAVGRGAAGGGPERGAVAAAREWGVLPRAGEERSPTAEAAARRQVPAPLALQRGRHLLLRRQLRLVRRILCPPLDPTLLNFLLFCTSAPL